MSHYDSDDAYPKSPGLQPIKIRSTPSPSPPLNPSQSLDSSLLPLGWNESFNENVGWNQNPMDIASNDPRSSGKQGDLSAPSAGTQMNRMPRFEVLVKHLSQANETAARRFAAQTQALQLQPQQPQRRSSSDAEPQAQHSSTSGDSGIQQQPSTAPPLPPSFLGGYTGPSTTHWHNPAYNWDSWKDSPDFQFNSNNKGLELAIGLGPATDSGYSSAGNRKLGLHDTEMDLDDGSTVYTKSDVSVFTRYSYVSELVDLMLSSCPHPPADSSGFVKICSVLPGILTTFATKLGHEASSNAHQQSMKFIRQYRQYVTSLVSQRLWTFLPSSMFDLICSRLITGAFKRQWNGRSPSASPSPDRNDGMSFQERVDSWDLDEQADHPGPEAYPGGPDLVEIQDEQYSETEDHQLPDVSFYRHFLVETRAFKWLIARMNRDLYLITVNADCMATIDGTVNSAFQRSRVSGANAQIQTCTAIYRVFWDPVEFVTQQEYSDRAGSCLRAAITLTGCSSDAQALTCEEYMEQTWPLTGKYTLHALKGAVDTGTGHRCSLPDDSMIEVQKSGNMLMVKAQGLSDYAAEVGQQLGWLGSALHASPSTNAISYCSPVVIERRRPSPSFSGEPWSNDSEAWFEIRFVLDQTDEVGDSLNGQCWHGLFRNPVVAKGYPIPRRSEYDTGLDIPLNILAGLAQAHRATMFDGKLVIKGFSTMLVPTKRTEDMLIWHLLFNKDQRHISYQDHRVSSAQELYDESATVNDLERCRNILGWASVVSNRAGSSDANYSIRWSGLRRPHSGCALEKVSISGGKLITAGATFGVGLKDVPVHLKREGSYVEQIKYAYNNSVVLYDVDDKRAWLVNGASALLHLVRASLVHDSKDKFKSEFLFQFDELQESTTAYQPDSSIDVLINRHNMVLELYHDKDELWIEEVLNEKGELQKVSKKKITHVLFQDRVEQKYHILEQILEYQAKAASGLRLDFNPRENLEGFDFMDIATGRDPILPRMERLQPSGKGWVDFARAIQAVTLFGRGFGELIKPTAEADLCQSWIEVPKKKDYLAVSTQDLTELIEMRGDAEARPIRLVDEIYWHKPDKMFEPCKCKTKSLKRKFSALNNVCDRVQVLLPSASKFRRVKNPGPLESRGAVIFGHSHTFPLRWKDHGAPEERDEISTDVVLDSESRDSALGSSLSPSTLGNGTQSRTSRSSHSSSQGSLDVTPVLTHALENGLMQSKKPKVGRKC